MAVFKVTHSRPLTEIGDGQPSGSLWAARLQLNIGCRLSLELQSWLPVVGNPSCKGGAACEFEGARARGKIDS
jgi:hypothetical protein